MHPYRLMRLIYRGTKLTSEYYCNETRSFLVCDPDNTRPRIVNGWDMLTKVLQANLLSVMEGDGAPYQVRVWMPEHGHLRQIDLSMIREKNLSRERTWTWELSISGRRIAQLEVANAAASKAAARAMAGAHYRW